ncbi:enoyl-CoA hydratase-related protein [Brevundimonas sp.]|uniref:enoyl-CoA hydratase/isomerase family protein n=1 Tax=Brevundimonas sp. TaxID=1871086 RepID=UPI0025BA4D41|nr:enoyl-CoA hydratase-related protein [Brevundimonas sp.]
MTRADSVAQRRDGAVLTLTIDRPDKANALDGPTVDTLFHAFADPGDARVVVLTGAGERAFCSGADLSGPLPERTAAGFTRLLAAMDDCPVPIIARVNGGAAGGGVGLLCAADIVIASDAASVVTPEGRVGLFPFMILPYLLRVASTRRVAEMAYTGRRLSSAEALDAGFFTTVTPATELDPQVSQTAAAIAAMGPRAMRLGRQTFLRRISADGGPDERMAQAFRDLASGPEALEGLAARRERRAPAWTIT